MFVERRAYPRAGIDCRVNIFSGLRIMAFNSQTVNISAGGVRVNLEYMPQVGSPLELQLSPLHELIPLTLIPLKCLATVVWFSEKIPPRGEQRIFDTGIKFIDIAEEDRDKICGAVTSFISEAAKAK